MRSDGFLSSRGQGTDLEAMSVIQTVLSTARNPSQIVAFNMASQALNNSFFLDNLVSHYYYSLKLGVETTLILSH